MGGCCCCCASRGLELNSSTPFYHYPRVSEEHEPLSSRTTGLLVDTNLDTSIPDTYRPPPPPIPYELNARQPQTPSFDQANSGDKGNAAVQTTNTDSVEETNAGNTLETLAKDQKDSACGVQANIELVALKELEEEHEKSGELMKSIEPIVMALEEEEETCPVCLDEYEEENPKIITKCEHHFHLSCILEWMERSDTCPVCDQVMIFNPTIDE